MKPRMRLKTQQSQMVLIPTSLSSREHGRGDGLLTTIATTTRMKALENLPGIVLSMGMLLSFDSDKTMKLKINLLRKSK